MTVFNFTLSSAVSESIILKTCSLKCQKRVSKGGCGCIVMPFLKKKKKSTFSQVFSLTNSYEVIVFSVEIITSTSFQTYSKGKSNAMPQSC